MQIINKYKLLTFLSVFTSIALLASPTASAQDNNAQFESGRYRPQGRQIATALGREYDLQVYEVRTYDPEPAEEAFSAATIFYPLTLSFAPPFGAAVLMPGYTGTQENYDWWGPLLASLGIAVMIVDTNTPQDSLAQRRDALVAAVDFLRRENSDATSPIEGKIDTSKLAILGHSLGGGAILHAASTLGDQIQAAIPLLPYCCELGQSFDGDFADLTVPTMIVATATDTIAPPAEHAALLYNAIADGTDRAYVEFATGTHNLPTNAGEDLASLGHFAIAWLKLHLDGDQRFASSFASGGPHADLLSQLEAAP